MNSPDMPKRSPQRGGAVSWRDHTLGKAVSILKRGSRARPKRRVEGDRLAAEIRGKKNESGAERAQSRTQSEFGSSCTLGRCGLLCVGVPLAARCGQRALPFGDGRMTVYSS